ncbi:MAG: hypothetical protein KDA45_13630 [Planctomycetales bacterium]|nr:hypothetical protein [Planctomycetales bacterium]
MNSYWNRRTMLHSLGAATLAASHFPLRGLLPRVSAQETQLSPALVSLDSGIEPLVELIEQTDRSALLEVIADRVAKGLAYQQLLAALLLAGVRNVQPRPSVGFKFHSVLVVNSAHLASLASSSEDRWLPIFWALDYFKKTQLEEERQSGWKLRPVPESHVPSATQARAAFIAAMDKWDAEAADVAIAGLARTAGANELFELFCRYGARDYRSIGHKAIYVANSFRTLQCIGWQHAEPVLRSLAYALQNHGDEDNPAHSDHAADRPWRQNLELLGQIPDSWQDGGADERLSRQMIHAFRDESGQAMAQQAVALLQQGAGAQTIWDAVLLASGELLMQQPGIIGLHSLTTANALRYAYQTSGDNATRQMLLLQACAFLPMFRQSAAARGQLAARTIDQLTHSEANNNSSQADSPEALSKIFDTLNDDSLQAAELLLGYLRAGGSANDVLQQARRLIFLKGKDAHDYKFSSAVLEDYHHVSRPLRQEFLALSVFNLRGTGDSDNGLVSRIRGALAV